MSHHNADVSRAELIRRANIASERLQGPIMKLLVALLLLLVSATSVMTGRSPLLLKFLDDFLLWKNISSVAFYQSEDSGELHIFLRTNIFLM